MWSMVLEFHFVLMLCFTSHLSQAQDSSSNDSPKNNCYTFHDVGSTWEEARDACRDMGSHLVTMETMEEWNKVKSLIAAKVAKDKKGYTHWYIGLRKESGTGKWTEEGSPGVTVDTNDNSWQRNQPSNTPGENCAEINSEYPAKVYGKFNNVECKYEFHLKGKYPRGYICENY